MSRPAIIVVIGVVLAGLFLAGFVLARGSPDEARVAEVRPLPPPSVSRLPALSPLRPPAAPFRDGAAQETARGGGDPDAQLPAAATPNSSGANPATPSPTVVSPPSTSAPKSQQGSGETSADSGGVQ